MTLSSVLRVHFCHHGLSIGRHLGGGGLDLASDRLDEEELLLTAVYGPRYIRRELDPDYSRSNRTNCMHVMLED